jgi:hypothetical protein
MWRNPGRSPTAFAAAEPRHPVVVPAEASIALEIVAGGGVAGRGPAPRAPIRKKAGVADVGLKRSDLRMLV